MSSPAINKCVLKDMFNRLCVNIHLKIKEQEHEEKLENQIKKQEIKLRNFLAYANKILNKYKRFSKDHKNYLYSVLVLYNEIYGSYDNIMEVYHNCESDTWDMNEDFKKVDINNINTIKKYFNDYIDFEKSCDKIYAQERMKFDLEVEEYKILIDSYISTCNGFLQIIKH